MDALVRSGYGALKIANTVTIVGHMAAVQVGETRFDGSLLPFTADVISDAVAWEMAHPDP